METTKTISFGKIAYNDKKRTNLVTVEITLKEDKNGRPVFSASANVWNNRKTDIYMGGQCLDTIYEDYKYQLSDLPLYEEILGLWERNHLNDLNAGTKEQTAAIEAWEAEGNKYDYTEACEYLKSIGMYEVQQGETMYKYGHGWVYREISEDDLKAIREILKD